MGMDQRVRFPGDSVPPWPAVRDMLARQGLPVQVRMIDGELAFPDEEPPETWREIRVGTLQGMVTVRREDDGLVFVVWGNADEGLRRAWNLLTWAFASAGGGEVLTPTGPQTPEAFRQAAGIDLPERGA